MEGHPSRPRLTQEERSAETRARLLDATIESLIEVGYARTTTSRVCETAGLSRGAQIHHYPTKAELVVAAIDHLARRRLEDLHAKAELLEGAEDRLSAALDFLWESFSGPLFFAALELWVAARTDRELSERLLPVERNLGGWIARHWQELVGVSEQDAAPLEDMMRLSIHLMRGMALERLLKSAESDRRRRFELWKQLVSTATRTPAIGDSAPRPRRESAAKENSK